MLLLPYKEVMPPKRIKRKQSDRSQELNADEDKISDLPRNAIDCILGKMPIREAVRTSVLSKKWRLYYLTISRLVFDYPFWKELQDFANRSHLVTNLEVNYLFDEIVTKSLMLHPGQIEKFKVCIPSLNSTRLPDVNKWILFLSRKNIKDLELKYKKDPVGHKLPPYFFSCLDLTSLKLQNFVLSPPLEFNGFLNLHQLILIGVYFANNCFASFISSCPVLEKLRLRGCLGIHRLNISGSNLKKLSIKANDMFKSISLENAPNLSEVSISLEKVVAGLDGCPLYDLDVFLGSLPKIKILCLDGKFLQFLVETPVLSMLSTLPYSLEILKLKGVNFMDFNQISVVVCLLRSAQNLQELYIEASTIMQDQELVLAYLEHLDYKNFPLRKLRLAKLTKISRFLPEFEFMRFLLLSSPSLVKMSILEHPNLKAEDALDITRKLLQLQPPSAVSIDFLRESSRT